MNWLKKFDLKTIMIMILCVVLLFRSCGGGEEEEKEIKNLLPPAVDHYIMKHQLYRAESPPIKV